MLAILIIIGIILCFVVAIYIIEAISGWLEFNSIPARTHYVYLTYKQLINFLSKTSFALNYDDSTAWFETNSYLGRIRIKMPFFSYLIFADRIKEINKNKYKISYNKLMADYTLVSASEDSNNENH